LSRRAQGERRVRLLEDFAEAARAYDDF